MNLQDVNKLNSKGATMAPLGCIIPNNTPQQCWQERLQKAAQPTTRMQILTPSLVV